MKRFGKVTGTTGAEKQSVKRAVKLISDVMFSKRLLTETSWTGISRSSTLDKKFPFSCLTSVISLIHEIMIRCDNRWNEGDTETVLRDKILKHSHKRNMAYMEKLNKKNSRAFQL